MPTRFIKPTTSILDSFSYRIRLMSGMGVDTVSQAIQFQRNVVATLKKYVELARLPDSDWR